MRRRLPSIPFVIALGCLIAGASHSPIRASDGSSTPIEALDSISIEGPITELRTRTGTLYRLHFVADDLLRIEVEGPGGPGRTEDGDHAPIVLQSEWPAPSLEIEEREGAHVFTTASLQLTVRHHPLLMELRRSSDGQLLWQELRPLRITEAGTLRTLSSDPSERFYGGGQQNGAFQFDQRTLEISYSGGWEEGDRPSPAPFYMSDRGYGLLHHTWSDGTYDFRSDGYLTLHHAEARSDVYVMVADSIHGVLDLYTRLTGRARLLPRWALGYGDADCYNDGDNVNKPGTVPEGWSDGPTGTTPDVVETVAAKYREHDMPGSWILPNDGYGCGYEDLPGVVAGLAEHGFRTGLWTEDGVEKIAWEVGTAGSRAQKLDVAWTGKGYRWAMDANRDAAQGILDHSDSRPFLWTVMGWAGIQRYAVTWTGDQSGGWDFIRWHVPTLIGSGLSGMSYSTGDVDGIFGGSPELYTRDLQWKSFGPVLMGMSGWSKSARKHPWWFDEPHRSIHRRYLKLRQRLMPYLYTLARETEATGAPMVRGTQWDHPNDARGESHPYQFFLGKELLIAPVYRSQAASGGWREGVYLPAGRWIDFWQGRVLDAGPDGRLVNIPVELDDIPVLVRAGAILPLYPESLYDGELPPDPLTLDLYPASGIRSDFLLYEDDGNTRQYLEGHHAEQRFVLDTAADGKRIDSHIEPARGSYDGMPESRRHIFQVHVDRAPASVQLDGSPLSAGDSGKAPGWTFDADDRGGLLRVHTGRLDVRQPHHLILRFAHDATPKPGSGYPSMPPEHATVPADAIRVAGRPAEEPGHPLENAFDGDPDTWFRTVRDQSVAYGPHELTLHLGSRRLVEGFRVSPRNDKHWKYGQIRDYELYLSDANGEWGEPIAEGQLEQLESEQEVRFPARAGRLLRLRVLSTHDDVDPMVLGARDRGRRPYDAQEPLRVGPTTLSELVLLEKPVPDLPAITRSLADDPARGAAIELDGLRFEEGLVAKGEQSFDYRLEGAWHLLRAEAGRLGTGPGTLRFQVWGDGRLIWDSGEITGAEIVKPRIDIRGISELSLRTVTADPQLETAWVDVVLEGYEGDRVAGR